MKSSERSVCSSSLPSSALFSRLIKPAAKVFHAGICELTPMDPTSANFHDATRLISTSELKHRREKVHVTTWHTRDTAVRLHVFQTSTLAREKWSVVKRLFLFSSLEQRALSSKGHLVGGFQFTVHGIFVVAEPSWLLLWSCTCALRSSNNNRFCNWALHNIGTATVRHNEVTTSAETRCDNIRQD